MPTANINGFTMNYVEQGSEPSVVLLHGFPHDSRLWNAQVESLSKSFRIIAPDLRGFGKSASAEKFTMKSLADDVHALLHSIGALPCVLGGLSMGGYIALEFAHKYPSRLRGLILLDTRADGDSPQAREGREKMIKLAAEKGAAAVAEQMLPKTLSEKTMKDRPEIVSKVRQMMESQPPKTMENALAAMRDRSDCSGLLPSIAVPVLIVVGEQDQTTPPEVAHAMAKSIRNATVKVIPNASHASCVEQPDAVSSAMRGFVGSIDK